MSDTETVEPANRPDNETDTGNASHAAQRDRLVRDAAQLAEAAKKTEQERQQKDADRAAAGDITDAQSRYAQALGSTYDIRDPYRSLANAAMVEYASFHRQQDALRKEAAAEQDPDKRRLIEELRVKADIVHALANGIVLQGLADGPIQSGNDSVR